MKLAIISGTPKMDGITHSFLQVAVDTADGLGIDADVIRLAGKGGENLTKCKMCSDGWGICFSEHRCEYELEDGFGKLHHRMQDADAYVYITPVYWGEISEDMKIFLDKLRRCEATRRWDKPTANPSKLKGKPSIIVANAGGGGGGIVTTFADFERAISQMEGDDWPRETCGIFDMIAVNRWNQDYKRDALRSAITEMYKHWKKKD